MHCFHAHVAPVVTVEEIVQIVREIDKNVGNAGMIAVFAEDAQIQMKKSA